VPDAEFGVQKVDWYQFRTASGEPFLVMVASLPNGYYTAVPCRVSMTLAPHSHMALGASIDEALAQLQNNLSGKTVDEIFTPE
jgi:hypothetical protein